MALTCGQRRTLAGLRLAAMDRLLTATEQGALGLLAAAAGPGDREVVAQIRVRQTGVWWAVIEGRRTT